MKSNQLNNTGSQPKDSKLQASLIKLDPNFDDLQKPETFIQHIDELKGKIHLTSSSIFNGKSANDWLMYAKDQPTPRMLFDEFWYEYEICILFADTNAGKSILAVQIADSISKGVSIPGFKFDAGKQAVHYFDFELNAKQFEKRYSTQNSVTLALENHYQFDPDFKRIELSMITDLPKGLTFEEFICESLEQYVIKQRAKILIIDNVTFLSSETENGKDAQILMKQLKCLKENYKLSILVLAHTPKRNSHKPITKNDLQGSRMMMNFADSSFAIGLSSISDDTKYFKQVKVRNSALIYGERNVPTLQIIQKDSFLQFVFTEFKNELDHLQNPNDSDKSDIIQEVRTLSLTGYSQRKISQQLGIAVGTVNKYLNS